MKNWNNIKIPESWSDITFAEYKRIYFLLKELYKESATNTGYFDTTEMAGIILNEPYEVVIDMPSKFIPCLMFVVSDNVINNEVKDEIKFTFGVNSKTYSTKQLTENNITLGRLEYYRQITKNIENSLKTKEVTEVLMTDLEEMTAEQRGIYNGYLNDCVEQRLLHANELTACMIQAIINDKFDAVQIKKIENDLLQYPCNIVIELAFFLMNLFKDSLVNRMMQLIVNQLLHYYPTQANTLKNSETFQHKVLVI